MYIINIQNNQDDNFNIFERDMGAVVDY